MLGPSSSEDFAIRAHLSWMNFLQQLYKLVLRPNVARISLACNKKWDC